MIISTPIIAMVPAIWPISARIISPSERPSRRVEAHRTMKSCTAPANTTPSKQPQRAGQIAHLGRQHRADQRAGAGNRREVVAEQDVFVGRAIVEPVVESGRRGSVRFGSSCKTRLARNSE